MRVWYQEVEKQLKERYPEYTIRYLKKRKNSMGKDLREYAILCSDWGEQAYYHAVENKENSQIIVSSLQVEYEVAQIGGIVDALMTWQRKNKESLAEILKSDYFRMDAMGIWRLMDGFKGLSIEIYLTETGLLDVMIEQRLMKTYKHGFEERDIRRMLLPEISMELIDAWMDDAKRIESLKQMMEDSITELISNFNHEIQERLLPETNEKGDTNE